MFYRTHYKQFIHHTFAIILNIIAISIFQLFNSFISYTAEQKWQIFSKTSRPFLFFFQTSRTLYKAHTHLSLLLHCIYSRDASVYISQKTDSSSLRVLVLYKYVYKKNSYVMHMLFSFVSPTKKNKKKKNKTKKNKERDAAAFTRAL